MFLIDLLHDLQVLLTLAFGLVVMCGTAQSKDPALLLDADLAFRGNQSSAGISIPNFLDTRLAKSSCISKSPILRRYLSFCFSNAASSIFGVSNAAAEFSRNSFFQRLIITGDSSYFTASSLMSLALLNGLNGHFCLELGVVLFSCLLHGAKLLIFNLSTCIKIREYYTQRQFQFL